jgi:hypothetical protein
VSGDARLVCFDLGRVLIRLCDGCHVETVTGFAPQQIIFFDDAIENVQGALAAGWRAHQVTDREDSVRQMRMFLAEQGLLATS